MKTILRPDLRYTFSSKSGVRIYDLVKDRIISLKNLPTADIESIVSVLKMDSKLSDLVVDLPEDNVFAKWSYENYDVVLSNYGFHYLTRKGLSENTTVDRSPLFPIQRVSQIVIDITTNCNLACRYCSRTHLQDMGFERGVLQYSTIDSIGEFLTKIHNKWPNEQLHIQAYGGEPLLCLNRVIALFRTIETAVGSSNFTMSIQTNGTLLDSKTVRLLYDHDIRLGLSIDGIGAIQQEQRGETSKRAIENIDNLLRFYAPEEISVQCVVTPANVETIPEMVDYFVSEYSLQKFSFVPVVPTDRFRTLLPAKSWAKSISTLAELKTQYHSRVGIEPIDSILQLCRTGFSSSVCRNSFGCLAGVVMFHISIDGAIYSCPESVGSKEYCLGSILSSLDEIIESGSKLLSKLSSRAFLPFVAFGCPITRNSVQRNLDHDFLVDPYSRVESSIITSVFLNYADSNNIDILLPAEVDDTTILEGIAHC